MATKKKSDDNVMGVEEAIKNFGPPDKLSTPKKNAAPKKKKKVTPAMKKAVAKKKPPKKTRRTQKQLADVIAKVDTAIANGTSKTAACAHYDVGVATYNRMKAKEGSTPAHKMSVKEILSGDMGKILKELDQTKLLLTELKDVVEALNARGYSVKVTFEK